MSTSSTSSLSYTFWDLYELRLYTDEWIGRAAQAEVDIEPMLQGIHFAIANSHALINIQTGKINEVALIQQMRVRSLYCSQIIREITKQKILRLANAALQNQALTEQHPLIERCKNWALRQLPPEIFLHPPKEMATICQVIEDKVDEMREKIISKSNL